MFEADDSGATFRNMSASTDEAYITFAETKGFEPISIELPEDATAHWVGSPDAEKILVVFHGERNTHLSLFSQIHRDDNENRDLTRAGGGFVYPATTQFQFLYDVLQETGPGTAGVILSYSLAPGKLYPHQLKQSLALMTHLINTEGKKPENMILAGDSAGATLILGLFSHMLHPHPSIPPLEMNGPLKGAVLVSPWVNFTHAAPSYTRNRKKDMVNQYVLTRWARYYTGDAPADAYSQPGTATEQWWQRIETKVESIIITAGGNEVMFDDIYNFSQTLKVCYKPHIPNEFQFHRNETLFLSIVESDVKIAIFFHSRSTLHKGRDT